MSGGRIQSLSSISSPPASSPTASEQASDIREPLAGSYESTSATKLAKKRCPSSSEEAENCGVQIVCCGLMRTGLGSLHTALRNLGFSNIYDREDIVSNYNQWDKVLHNDGGREMFESMFRSSEVVMGMPIFCFWEQITECYPNAQVILTVRNEDEWWESIVNAKSLMHDGPGAPLSHGSLMRRLEKVLIPSYHKFCNVLRFAWAAALGAHALENDWVNEAVARSNFRKHNSYVQYVLGSQTIANGAPRCLVYNIREGWDPLCKFLDKERPEFEFPTVKQVPHFPGQPPGQQMMNQNKGANGRRHSFEDMLQHESDFGMHMRKELRWGFAKAVVILVLLISCAVLTLNLLSVRIGPEMSGLLLVVVIGVGWNGYVVMHGLVLRMPVLVVLPMAMKSSMIAGALQACFITYGILKEMLVTQDRIASPVLVLSSRFAAIVCGMLALLATEGRVSFGAPLQAMAAFAFTNEASTWAGYEMLKYVSFPITVMAKSVKMLPSMLMGRILNGTKYTLFQYLQASTAFVCVAIMHLSDGHAGNVVSDKEESMSFYHKLCLGFFLLSSFFVCDSFTSQWQNSLYKKHPSLTQTQMMLGGNLLGFLLTSGTFFASWPKVQASIDIAMQSPAVLGRIVLLGIVYALGQFCIYSAIRILGPLSFTWIMTARNLLSVLISIVFFGHGVNTVKVLCIMTVFGIMSAKQLTQAMPEIGRHAVEFKTRAVGRPDRSRSKESSRKYSKKMS